MNRLIKGYFLTVMEKIEQLGLLRKRIAKMTEFDPDDFYDDLKKYCSEKNLQLSISSMLEYLHLIKGQTSSESHPKVGGADKESHFKIKKGAQIVLQNAERLQLSNPISRGTFRTFILGNYGGVGYANCYTNSGWKKHIDHYSIVEHFVSRFLILVYEIFFLKKKLTQKIEELSLKDFPYENMNIYDFQALLFTFGPEFRFEVEDLRIFFQLIDRNVTGRIGYRELRTFLVLFGEES